MQNDLIPLYEKAARNGIAQKMMETCKRLRLGRIEAENCNISIDRDVRIAEALDVTFFNLLM